MYLGRYWGGFGEVFGRYLEVFGRYWSVSGDVDSQASKQILKSTYALCSLATLSYGQTCDCTVNGNRSHTQGNEEVTPGCTSRVMATGSSSNDSNHCASSCKQCCARRLETINWLWAPTALVLQAKRSGYNGGRCWRGKYRFLERFGHQDGWFVCGNRVHIALT
jgi:hypothetical protein